MENRIDFPEKGLQIIRVSKKANLKLLLTRIENIVIFIKLLSRGFRPRDIASTIIKYNFARRIIKDKGIKLVVTYNMYESLFGFYVKREFGSKVSLFTMVFAEALQGMKAKPGHRNFLKSVLLASDQVISSSRYCAGLYQTIGFDPGRIKVIYIGVDINDPRQEEHQIDQEESLAATIPSGCRMILFFGRFLRDMGLDVVLDCIPQVLEKTKNVCFLLAGAKGDLDERAESIRSKYPDRIFIHHNIPNELVSSYFRNCSILLAPTKADRACMGLSIKDAMAWGKPVIVTDSGGITEAVLDGKTGLVIPLYGRERIDSTELEKAILQLVDQPGLLDEMGRNARRRVIELFDKSTEAIRWLHLIDSATKQDAE